MNDTVKLPAAAGEGWTLYNGTNQPTAGSCEIITRDGVQRDYYESQLRQVSEWDWSIDGSSWDIIAFRVLL